MTNPLRAYVRHRPTCAVWDCQHCGWNQRMHDAAEDIDEVTCIGKKGKGFTPKTECTCGLEAVLAASPPQPNAEVLAIFRRLRDAMQFDPATRTFSVAEAAWFDQPYMGKSLSQWLEGAALAAEPPDPHVARRQLPILKKLHAPAEVIEEAERLATAPLPQQDDNAKV